MTIIEFLLARVAEDEASARAIPEWDFPSEGWWDWKALQMNELAWRRSLHRYSCSVHDEFPSACDCGGPARVLAECVAKRRIVERYAENLDRAMSYRNPKWRDAMNDADRLEHRLQEARLATSLEACLALVATYADHPDYQEWADTRHS